MNTGKVRVAVNGYGVIGKRVADAVALQDDMELIGISDVVSDYRIRVAVERGYAVFASVSDKRSDMEGKGIPVAGTLDDLLSKVDIIVDCTPKKVASKYKEMYQSKGVKALFQGGEKHELTGYSFVAQVNYAGALNRQFARVVSCNTTGLCRVNHALFKKGWIKRSRGVIMRRATDPWESHVNGMINTAVPEVRIPSHQGPDVTTVLPDLDITTVAGAGPYNLAHLHYLIIETTRKIDLDELRHALWEEPRISFVHASDGLVALNSVVELMRDLKRPRADMWEVGVWEDALTTDGIDAYITYQVDNEAIVIPENIDAIRALTGIERDPLKSIEKTNSSLGIQKSFLPKSLDEELIHKKMGARLDSSYGAEDESGFKGSEEPI